MLKKTSYLVGIILIAGLSGIIANRYIFPYLGANSFFSKCALFKKAGENVTVINKTEQIYIKEESSISKIADRIIPSVVSIASFPQDDPKNPMQKKIKEIINATGEIMTSDGIIMTTANAILPDYFSKNNFSLTNLDRVFKITTSSGNVYDGKLLAVDSWSNLAFLKIEASNLPAMPFSDSDECNPGEKLIYIGNDSFEYQNKFATGLLSSFEPAYNISGETLSKAEKMEGVFLADFNQENISAGGPVIDYSGQAIAVSGSIIKNGKIQYFQIPSNKIKKVLKKVIDGNSSSNISLGAYYLPVNKSLASVNQLALDRGAFIYSASSQQGLAVIFNSTADKAGLKINDLIIKVDDTEINLKDNLSDVLYEYKKGDKAEFTLLRENKEIKLTVQF